MRYDDSNWFYMSTKHSHISSRLFCFHQAGTSAAFFQSWVDLLPPDIQLVAIQLPGRPPRNTEPRISNINALISQLSEAVIPLLNKPYVLFGHSMGTVISYELLKALRRKNNLLPACFIISACTAPHLLISSQFSSLKKIKSLGELFQTDIALLESWKYQPEEIFNVPFMVCGGINDVFVPYVNLIEWQSHTKAEFSAHFYKGGHDYVQTYREKLIYSFLPYLNTYARSNSL